MSGEDEADNCSRVAANGRPLARNRLTCDMAVGGEHQWAVRGQDPLPSRGLDRQTPLMSGSDADDIGSRVAANGRPLARNRLTCDMACWRRAPVGCSRSGPATVAWA